jgi:hypothetical protein
MVKKRNTYRLVLEKLEETVLGLGVDWKKKKIK